MKILIAAAVVLLATGLHARAQEPQKSQWVLTIPTPGGQIWNPGIYTTREKCALARQAFLESARQIRVTRVACVELLNP